MFFYFQIVFTEFSYSSFAMAASLSGPNIEEEYMWAVTLDKDNKEYLWQPTDPADASSEEDEDDEGFDPSCKPNHRLLIKTALLSPDAPKDEVTVLEVETIGYKKEKVVTPFLALRSGVDLQRYVDLLLPDSATIKIKSGSGPITLVGSHCVDFYDYRNYGGDEEEDDEEESDDEDMEQEVEAAAVTKEEAVKEEEVEEGKKKKKSPQKEDKSPAKGEDKAGDAKKKSPAKEAKEPSPKKEATPGKEGKKEATPGKEGKKRKVSSEDSSPADGKKKRKGSDK